MKVFKIVKNAFSFILKALLILRIFKFLSYFFGHVGKWLNKRAKVNLKVNDLTAWLRNNYNTHVDQQVKAIRQ